MSASESDESQELIVQNLGKDVAMNKKNVLSFESVKDTIERIVHELKSEYKESLTSYDYNWVRECETRLSQMYYVCKELGVDYGDTVIKTHHSSTLSFQ